MRDDAASQADYEPQTRVKLLGGAVALVEDPLRRLFESAGLVALGTTGKSTVVERGEYTWEVRTDVAVSSVVKGETNERVISAFHDVMPNEEPDDRWLQGHRVLVFLDAREAEDGRGLAGYTVHTPWGFRQVSEAELAAYGRRLAALARAERRGTARESTIVRLDRFIRQKRRAGGAERRRPDQPFGQIHRSRSSRRPALPRRPRSHAKAARFCLVRCRPVLIIGRSEVPARS